MSTVAHAAPSRATTRQWYALAVLLVPTFLLTVDLGVLWLALPALSADLAATSSELLWINDGYGFATACLLILAGNLGDRYGHRLVVLTGSTLFVLASLLAALAPDPTVLIGARVLLGVAGAGVIPSTLAVISSVFVDPAQRARAVACWVTALSAGIAAGPALGGIVLQWYWWGAVFLVGVPPMLLALIAVPLLVPETIRRPTARVDRLSVALLPVTIASTVLAIKEAAAHGPNLLAAVAGAVGIAAGALFVRRQRRVTVPLIDPRLIEPRAVRVALGLLLLGMTALNGVQYLIPQYLTLVAGASVLVAGLLTVLPAVALTIGAQVTPALTRRAGPGRVIASGSVVSFAGFALLATLPAGPSGLVPAAAGMALVVLGLSPITVLGTDLASQAAPPDQAGQATSTGQTAYELGLALGVALVGSLVAAIYRTQLTASGLPAASEAAASYGAGFTVAQREGPALTAAVKQAFTHGVQAGALAAAALAALAGLLALLGLRPHTRSRQADPSPGHPR